MAVDNDQTQSERTKSPFKICMHMPVPNLVTQISCMGVANCDKVVSKQRYIVQLRIPGKQFDLCCYNCPAEQIGITLGQDGHMRYKAATQCD